MTQTPLATLSVGERLQICPYCKGEKFELRKRTIANNSVQFVYQCLQCGRAGSNPISRSQIPNWKNVPPWDADLLERWEEGCSARAAAERASDKAKWLREHDKYLRTEAWRVRRLAVLKRAKGICEGCGNAVATQVHHLTYDHWREEFLWELVAICDDCHERIHPHMQESG